MEFAVLGPLQVNNGQQALDIGGPRQRRLLAALIADADEVLSTDRLIEIVFQQEPPRGAANTIRTYVARLRKALATAGSNADEIIVTRPPGYGFSSDGHRIDAVEFAARADEGGKQVAADPVNAIATLEDALAMWRGPAYEEFIYEDWARPEIDRLEELRATAQENLIEARLACGLHEEAVPDLRHLVAEHPLRERPWRLLVIALYRSGRQVEALRTAERFGDGLAEVGLEPSGEMVALERSVAAHDPALHLAQPAGRPLRGYRLGQLIGEGAHGVVYQGIQPGIGREVAVKAIRVGVGRPAGLHQTIRCRSPACGPPRTSSHRPPLRLLAGTGRGLHGDEAPRPKPRRRARRRVPRDQQSHRARRAAWLRPGQRPSGGSGARGSKAEQRAPRRRGERLPRRLWGGHPDRRSRSHPFAEVRLRATRGHRRPAGRAAERSVCPRRALG